MKIAIVGQFDNYGTMGTYVADAWEANGHKVTRVDRREIALPLGIDVAIHVDCSEDYSSQIITKTSRSTQVVQECAINVFWSLDAHMPGGTERSVNIARKCDLVFSTNYEHGVKILEKFGIESFLLPVTYHDKYLATGTQARQYQAVMIGNPNSPERKQLWDLLQDKYSSTFTGIAKEEKDYVYAMRHAQRVINQPTEPWNNILNNRFFEALAIRATLYQKRLKTDLIERLGFEDGKHFIYWDDFDDLQEKLDENIILDKNEAHKIVQTHSMRSQCSKMEAVILSKFYDRL